MHAEKGEGEEAETLVPQGHFLSELWQDERQEPWGSASEFDNEPWLLRDGQHWW